MARRRGRSARARRRSGRTRRRRGGRLLAGGACLALVGLVALGAYVSWLDGHVRTEFAGKRWAVPARVYARPLDLYPGAALSANEFERELRRSGYHEVQRLGRPGSYARRGETFEVLARRFVFWDGVEGVRRLSVRFEGRRLASLQRGGRVLDIARLDPALIGRLYPAHHEDRVLVRLPEVPRALIGGLLAVEDRRFFEHPGISPRAIARALLANLRAGAVVQGGSTLTQQLARSFFLSPERSLARKLREALVALLLEGRFDKEEILEAYLNEIFLGQEGGRAIHGFGLAAEHYFARPLEELRLAEQALLVALVRGPSYYDPRRHPERARRRRDRVLRVMAEHQVVSPAQARAAAGEPLGVTAEPAPGRSPHPGFLDLVRRQLRRDYREADLRTRGLRVFTTLDPRVQYQAERALSGRIRSLESRAGLATGALQGAMVVTGTQGGTLLALVGARDPATGGFNRALDAVRPVGSLIKPAVYLTALERPDRYTLVSPVDDRRVRVRGPDGEIWAPANYDGRYHGTVALHTALAHSYNAATVRLGMALGLRDVAQTVRRLGIQREVARYPSMLLGAVALSPFEVAQMYQTIASGGFRTPLRAIRSVTDAHGKPLRRYHLSVTQAFPSGPVYLLTRALQEVMRSGTGRSARARLSAQLGIAGKTGTTDELRDSWFAGFDGRRLGVVWLGRDDNTPAGLTGAAGALQVFVDWMAALPPHPLSLAAPQDIEWHWTSPGGGRRTDPGCAGAVRVPYLAGSAPDYARCPGARLEHSSTRETASALR